MRKSILLRIRFSAKAETDEVSPEDVLAIEEGMEEAEEMPAEERKDGPG
jgi:hypothetical protein